MLRRLASCIVASSCLLAACAVTPDDPVDQAASSLVTGVDLHLGLLGPGAVPANGLASYQVVVSHLGSLTAQNTQVLVQLPPGVTFVAGLAGCSATGTNQVLCPFGAFSAQRSLSRSFYARHAAAGTATLSAAVSTTSVDVNPANNNATADTAVGPALPSSLPFQFPQGMVAALCPGNTRTSFAPCASSALVTAPFTLEANGTISTTGPVGGTWSQPSGPSSLRIEFRNLQGAVTSIYQGGATSGRCVEGFNYTPTMALFGVFRACAQ